MIRFIKVSNIQIKKGSYAILQYKLYNIDTKYVSEESLTWQTLLKSLQFFRTLYQKY